MYNIFTFISTYMHIKYILIYNPLNFKLNYENGFSFKTWLKEKEKTMTL